jgi:hypothetical protein
MSENSGASINGALKENSGASARRRNRQRAIAIVIGAITAYTLMRVLYQSRFSGWLVPDTVVDERGNFKTRRRPERHYRKDNPVEATRDYDAVLEGYLTLVDLQIPIGGLQGMSERYNARATFCSIDWRLQQKKPSDVPMFRDLQAQSKMCQATKIVVDLFDVVQEAKQYDANFATGHEIVGKKPVIQVVPPTGVVFHETRCGSTLFANLMAAFSPEHSRVFSESPPPVAALKACDLAPCNPDLHSMLIQDVFYIMGRTVRKETPQYVFYKIQSIGSMDIDKFAAAMPNVPWVFIYRDTVEILQSHLGKIRGALSRGQRPVCARNYGNVYQPQTTLQVIQRSGKKLEDLTLTEYCAAHLAGLSLSAIQEYDRTQRGRFVNYKQMPGVVWDDIFPDYFKVPITVSSQSRMERAAMYYSKGRGDKAGEEWEDDVKKKQESASPAVVRAADIFTRDVFQRMEQLSAS